MYDWLKQNKFKILTGTGIMFLLSLVDPSSQVQANICQDNPATFPNSCSKTPEVYKARIYEMGFCKSDPLAGTTATGVNNNTNTDNKTSEEVAGDAEKNLSSPIKGAAIKVALVETCGFLAGKVLNFS